MRQCHSENCQILRCIDFKTITFLSIILCLHTNDRMKFIHLLCIQLQKSSFDPALTCFVSVRTVQSSDLKFRTAHWQKGDTHLGSRHYEISNFANFITDQDLVEVFAYNCLALTILNLNNSHTSHVKIHQWFNHVFSPGSCCPTIKRRWESP